MHAEAQGKAVALSTLVVEKKAAADATRVREAQALVANQAASPELPGAPPAKVATKAAPPTLPAASSGKAAIGVGGGGGDETSGPMGADEEKRKREEAAAHAMEEGRKLKLQFRSRVCVR